jgi:hypothetical protein
MAEVGAPLQLWPGESLGGCEGLVVRLRADEHAYTCVLRTQAGVVYSQRFTPRLGYNTLRLPFNAFRAAAPNAPPLQPGGWRLRAGGAGWSLLAPPGLSSA